MMAEICVARLAWIVIRVSDDGCLKILLLICSLHVMMAEICVTRLKWIVIRVIYIGCRKI